MTRSKRARRIARREYAEKHAGQPPIRTVQPSSASGNSKRLTKQKPATPFYRKPEVINALYLVVSGIAIALLVYWFYDRQKSTPTEVQATPTVISSNASTSNNPSSSSDASVSRKTYSAPPAMTIDPNKTYVATIETDKGNIKVELYPKEEPITVNNFVFLAREGFYNGTTFHRVLKDFVAQGGDPKGDGTGGPGYSIQDEFGSLKHTTGAIAMAHSAAPNSAGSQFYICLAPQPSLDGKYAVFGQVTEGMDVVQKITLRNPDERPTFTGDKINRITIEEK